MNSNPPETRFVPYSSEILSSAQSMARGESHFDFMDQRRSVRDFSDRPVPRAQIAWAIRAASTAPSGAHRQPWKFVVIGDANRKQQIREAAEREEYESYVGGRMPDEWRAALAPIGTDWQKPFLTTVPWIVVVFEESYRIAADGQREKNYYVKESVGIACGLFISALHHMGLSTLTHTPSPMGFLSDLLERPPNERPFILFPIGYAAEPCHVPDLKRKSLDEVSVWMEDPPALDLSSQKRR